VVRWHGDAIVEACYTMKAPPLLPQATFYRPGSGQQRVAQRCKGRACQQEGALGKQWWRLAMWHTQHWVGQRGNNRHLSHVASTTRQASQHNRCMVVGPLLQKSEDGKFWHTQLTCTFAILKCLNYVACTRPQFWVMLEWWWGWEDNTKVIHLQIYVVMWLSHSHVIVGK